LQKGRRKKVEKEKQVKELEEAEPVLPFQLSLGPSLIVFIVFRYLSTRTKIIKYWTLKCFQSITPLPLCPLPALSVLPLPLSLSLCPSGSIDDKGAVGIGIGIGRNEGRSEVTMIIHILFRLRGGSCQPEWSEWHSTPGVVMVVVAWCWRGRFYRSGDIA
jgi:hypothetical protein